MKQKTRNIKNHFEATLKNIDSYKKENVITKLLTSIPCVPHCPLPSFNQPFLYLRLSPSLLIYPLTNVFIENDGPYQQISPIIVRGEYWQAEGNTDCWGQGGGILSCSVSLFINAGDIAAVVCHIGELSRLFKKLIKD